MKGIHAASASVLRSGARKGAAKPLQRPHYAALADLVEAEPRPVLSVNLPAVSFLKSIVPSHEASSYSSVPRLSAIGNTPLVRLARSDENTYVKMEGHNPGGSLKDRTIATMVLKKLANGELDRKTGSAILVTSGSAGVSLVEFQEALLTVPDINFDTLVVMPKSYADEEVPQRIISNKRTRVFESIEALKNDFEQAGGASGVARVLLLDGLFIDVQAEARELSAAQGWSLLDQHRDENCKLAHKSTADEIMQQLPGVTDVVVATGTGATAAGLRDFLPKHVRVHARPAASDAGLSGLTDVRRYDNFCDTTTLSGYTTGSFKREPTVEHQDLLKSSYGLVGGPSSGATYWLAKQVREKEGRDAVICLISSDGHISEPIELHGAAFGPVGPARATGTMGAAATGRRAFSSLPAYDESDEEPVVDEGALQLTCSGCGHTVNGTHAATFKCPNHDAQPDVDHVLVPAAFSSAVAAAATSLRPDDEAIARSADLSANPFLRYRSLLYSHRAAMARGMTDPDYIEMVSELDSALEQVDGSGFKETPLRWEPSLNAFIKVEVGNVAQSHKARHLANVLLYLTALRRTESDGGAALSSRRLAVASCGNAGLAAATLAAAARWPIDVCIPPEASDAVVKRLGELGANIVICERGGRPVQTPFGPVSTEGAADPCMAAFQALVSEHGSLPLSCQGPECALAVEGGQTLAWEVATALARDHADAAAGGLERAFIQVGGGAFGAGLAQGLRRAAAGELSTLASGAPPLLGGVPAMHFVQPVGNNPLGRAHAKLLLDGCSAGEAAKRRADFMFPWDQPSSVAGGILDDETYDFVALLDAVTATGGATRTVDDDEINAAKDVANRDLGVNACHTGVAGLAGLFQARQSDEGARKPDLVVLTGVDRS